MKYLIVFVFILLRNISIGQIVINGDFENTNGLNNCLVNPSDTTFNSYMNFCSAFGGKNGNIDISDTSACFSPSTYCPNRISGRWYISLSSNPFAPNADKISLKLSDSLRIGRKYMLTYYEYSTIQKFYYHTSVKIGLSRSNKSIGENIIISFPDTNKWTKRSIEFISPISANYLTVTVDSLVAGSNAVDKFELSEVLGIENNILSKNQFILFPQNQFINITSDYNGSLEIYNLTGQSILKKDILKGNTELPFTQEQQIYYYVFQTPDGKYSKGKLVMSFE